MNRGMKNEISLLLGAVAGGLLLARSPRLAAGFAVAAVGLRALNGPPRTFRNCSVIITGGSRGLGFALAEKFVAEGAWVTLVARDPNELAHARYLLERYDVGEVFTVAADVTDPDALSNAFDEVIDQFGRIDVVVNNAGAIPVGPVETMDAEDFDAQLKLHLDASVNGTQMILPYFRRMKSGAIVNISSIGGKIPVPHLSSYCASKFALAGFSETLAAEVRRDGVRVTTVYPGLMRTGSSIQAVFKGDTQREYAWFAVASSAPGLTTSAEHAAARILDAVRHGDSQLIITLPAKAAVIANTLFPELFSNLMSVTSNMLPRSFARERRTGAASQSWFSLQRWSAPFRKTQDDAGLRLNQTESFDAEFKLGLGDKSHH